MSALRQLIQDIAEMEKIFQEEKEAELKESLNEQRVEASSPHNSPVVRQVM